MKELQQCGLVLSISPNSSQFHFLLSRTSIIVRLWDAVLWLDDWKKGVLYFVLLSPPCFVRPFEALLGVISGQRLLISFSHFAFKYLCTCAYISLCIFSSMLRIYSRFYTIIKKVELKILENPNTKMLFSCPLVNESGPLGLTGS